MSLDSSVGLRLQKIIEETPRQLAEAALLAAQLVDPALDIEPYLEEVESLAARVAQRAAQTHEALMVLAILTDEIHHRRNFRAVPVRDDDIVGTCFQSLLERNTGSSLLLAVLYLDVGARVGLPLQGVALSTSLWLRLEVRGDIYLIDPENPLCVCSLAECLPNKSAADASKLLAESASAGLVISRLLCNMKNACAKAKAFDKALRLVDFMVHSGCLQKPSLYRDRAVLYMQLEAFGLALRDLEHYIEKTDNLAERQMFQIVVGKLRQHISMLN